MLAVVPAVALAAGTTACTAPGPPAAGPRACSPVIQAELFFGRTRHSGAPITAPEFAAFLDRAVTTRFPAGLTVLDGQGRWRAGDGRLTQEASTVVLLVLPAATEDADAGLQAIRAEYRAAFQQDSVGLVLLPGCGGF